MPIVGGLDIHRKQITFDYLDTATGEVRRGQIAPADRAHLRAWLARFAGRDDAAFALEGCTGWRYVAEELAAAGSNETRLICRPGFSLGAGALRRTPFCGLGFAWDHRALRAGHHGRCLWRLPRWPAAFVRTGDGRSAWCQPFSYSSMARAASSRAWSTPVAM
jgi:hypothetical protein